MVKILILLLLSMPVYGIPLARNFDGADDQLTINMNLRTAIGNDHDWSISTWIKNTVGVSGGNGGSGDRCLVNGYTASPSVYFWVIFKSGANQWYWGYGNELIDNISTILTPRGVWYLFTITFSMGDKLIRIYINDTLAYTSGNLSGTLDMPSNAATAVGNFYPDLPTYWWNGGLSEMIFWSKCLSKYEISNMVRGVVCPKEPGVVCYLTFNEITGFPFDATGNYQVNKLDGTNSIPGPTASPFLEGDEQ